MWQTKDRSNKADVATTQTQSASSYEIKEWGVKIALRDSDKVQFSVEDTGGTLSNDKYDGTAVPTFKPAFLQDKTCTPGLALYRAKTKFSVDTNQKQIGEYYYQITGGPGSCSADPQHNPDDILKGRFLQDFDIRNISSI